jgi:hypothetical protein
MKRGMLVLSVAGLVLCAFALGRAGAQEGPDEKKAADEMAAWMELAKTGPEHAALQKTVGTWTVECKAWMAPGAEPTVSKGKAVFSSVLGGRFVRQEFEGSVMGQTFRGLGYNGYNNATKEYEGTWCDDMGTGIMFSKGVETEPGKVWTYKGSFFGPGGAEYKSRMVLTMVSDDQQHLEMFNDDGRGETKCMEMVYTRSK